MNESFINFTNHPSPLWSKEQTSAALNYGTIIDVPFPNVSPQITAEEVKEIGDRYVEDILSYHPAYVLAQGEFTLCFYVVHELLARGIKVGAACTERMSVESEGKKISYFKFVKCRDYVE